MTVGAHENRWMKLPRAAAASPEMRGEIQRRFRGSQASFLLTDASVTLAAGSSCKAISKLLKVFSLDRRYMTRLYTLKVMGLGLMFKLGFSRGQIALGHYV